MSREVIAVDVDDVLSDTAEGFIEYSNENYGTDLTIDDYTEHWMELWQVDIKETERRAAVFHRSGTVTQYAHKEQARPVLEHLSNRFKLIVTTSRNSGIINETHAWIEQYYGGIFSDIKFAGIYDGPLSEEMLHMTKADLFASNEVDYVIDDQLKHCLAAAQLGIRAILFGDYPWNQAASLPNGVHRCKGWAEVQEFFDARG